MKAPISPLDTWNPGTIVPRGLGVYLASGDVVDRDREPGREAARMLAAGVRWALLWVEAPDGRCAPVRRLESWSAALQGVGIRPWLWTFPRADRAASAVTRAADALEATGAGGLVLDVERPPPQLAAAGAPDWSPTTARELVGAAIDSLRERHGLGVTSYPARHGHQIPWDELAVGWGSPQLYRSADDQRAVDRSIAAYAAAHGTVIPVIDSYVGDAARLRAVWSRVLGDLDRPRVPAVAVWAWGTTDARERRELADLVARVGW